MYEVRVYPRKGEGYTVDCVNVSSPFEVVDVATAKTIRTFNEKAGGYYGFAV